MNRTDGTKENKCKKELKRGSAREREIVQKRKIQNTREIEEKVVQERKEK